MLSSIMQVERQSDTIDDPNPSEDQDWLALIGFCATSRIVKFVSSSKLENIWKCILTKILT